MGEALIAGAGADDLFVGPEQIAAACIRPGPLIGHAGAGGEARPLRDADGAWPDDGGVAGEDGEAGRQRHSEGDEQRRGSIEAGRHAGAGVLEEDVERIARRFKGGHGGEAVERVGIGAAGIDRVCGGDHPGAGTAGEDEARQNENGQELEAHDAYLLWVENAYPECL